MTKSNIGCQTIGCNVDSCRYHSGNHLCELSRIEVKPMWNAHTGRPEDESLCGSYCQK